MIIFTSELTKQERERRVRVVKLGSEGEFWKILKAEVETLTKIEESYLDTFKVGGIREKSIDAYNRSVGRLNTLKELLNMPTVIINSNESFLKQIIADTKKATKRYFSLLDK